jgi:hypothetical protein
MPMVIAGIAAVVAVIATIYFFLHGTIISYGDAESHLNIAKRVTGSVTPGFAQLGGIWLPLPHLLMVPFVYFNVLWRTGLAGSIVSGIAYVVSATYIFKLTRLLTKNMFAAIVAAAVFMLNPNALYMQSTAMTEMVLIAFFTLSSYFFILFLQDDSKLIRLISAAFFGLCASLSRYDGWALVLMEAGALVLLYLPRFFKREVRWSALWHEMEGRVVLFATLAFLGILLWLGWDGLILGDPLYFTHSQFSASSQQANWLAAGQLPAYHHLGTALVYYFYTSMQVVGVLTWAAALLGLALLLFFRGTQHRFLVALVLLVPFIFNIVTLFMGQSVIFIPGLTPPSFTWNLFNVRYGILMLPMASVCVGILFYVLGRIPRAVLVTVLAAQLVLFAIGAAPVLTYADGVNGLSSGTARLPDLQQWFTQNYDYGQVLVDDYVRPISLIRTGVPLENFIYVGNKPYWNDALKQPQDVVRWVIMSKDDSVWQALYADQAAQANLFKYYNKVYTSDQILVFRRIGTQ